MLKNRKLAAIKAIDSAGGATTLANDLNDLLWNELEKPITATRVQKWKLNGVPPRFVIPVAQITHTPRHDLHPMIYPDDAA